MHDRGKHEYVEWLQVVQIPWKYYGIITHSIDERNIIYWEVPTVSPFKIDSILLGVGLAGEPDGCGFESQ
jgi:hypothetical protein